MSSEYHHCLRCRKPTPSHQIRYVRNGGKHRLMAQCGECGGRKSQFVSSHSGAHHKHPHPPGGPHMGGDGVFDNVPYFGDALNSAGNAALDAGVPIARKYAGKAASYVGRKLGIPGAGVGKRRKMRGDGFFSDLLGGVGNIASQVAVPLATGLITKRFGGGVGHKKHHRKMPRGRGVQGYGVQGYGITAPNGGRVGKKGKKGRGILGGVLGSLLPF